MKLTRNAKTAAGLVLSLAGLYVVSSAWKGQQRPFLLRFLP